MDPARVCWIVFYEKIFGTTEAWYLFMIEKSVGFRKARSLVRWRYGTS